MNQTAETKANTAGFSVALTFGQIGSSASRVWISNSVETQLADELVSAHRPETPIEKAGSLK